MSYDKRTERRQDLSWPALIIGAEGEVMSKCRISNVSVSGAKLITQVETRVLDEFVLCLAGDNVVRRNCKVIWSSGCEIGVRFVESPLLRQTRLAGSLQT